MPQKILILAGDTDGNLGDLAIVTALCDTLRETDPNVRISLLSSCPDRDRQRLAIEPIRRGWRGLVEFARTAREADLVICGGGGLFQDDDSLLKMPYWAVRLAGVRLLAHRLAGLSIGAGPLDHRSSRLFARLALKALAPISVRDPLARTVLEPLTHKPIALIPDPAFLLEPADGEAARQTLSDADIPLDDKPLIGVALRRLFHKGSNLLPYKYAARIGLGRKRGARQMSALIEDLASLLNEVVTRTNAHVVFLPTYNIAHENDREVCEAVAAEMRTGTCSVLQTDDPKLYKAITGLLAVMFCGRMHPAILAAGCGTPIIGLAYNPKFQGMFSMLGQRDRCLSVTDLAAYRQTDRAITMLVEAIDSPSGLRPDTTELAESTRRFIGDLLHRSWNDGP